MLAHIAPLRRMPNAIKHFSYLIPEELEPRISRGSLVEIPLRGSAITGIVLEITATGETEKLKSIIRYLGIDLATQTDILEEAASYFAVTVPYLADALIPSPPKRWKEEVVIGGVTAPRLWQKEHRLIEIDSLDEESRILRDLAEETRNKQQTLHIVVPTLERAAVIADLFEGNDRVALATSEQSAGKLWSVFVAAQRGELEVLITTRRGILFTPSNLGRIIVIDEESSDHKQWDMKPRYDARTMADMVARTKKCGIIMMSLAPRLTTRHAFTYQAALPSIPNIIVHVNPNPKHPFSQPTLDAIEAAQDENKNVIVLSDIPVELPSGIKQLPLVSPLPPSDLIIILFPDRMIFTNEWTAEERMQAQILHITKQMKSTATLIIVATSAHRAFGGLLPSRREAYYEKLLAERKQQQYPPYGSFIKLIIQSGISLKDAEKKAEALRDQLRESGVEFLGPYPSDPPYVRGRHRALSLLHGTPEAIQRLKPRLISLPDEILVDIDPDRIFR